MAEGDEHRRQRKVISPAFSAQSLRALQPIFFAKALELRDTMLHKTPSNPEEGVIMDMNNWLWRTTFDIIGLAGMLLTFFSYAEREID